MLVEGNVKKSKEIKTYTKLRMFNSNIKSVLLCGSETRKTTKTLTNKLQSFVT